MHVTAVTISRESTNGIWVMFHVSQRIPISVTFTREATLFFHQARLVGVRTHWPCYLLPQKSNRDAGLGDEVVGEDRIGHQRTPVVKLAIEGRACSDPTHYNPARAP